MDLKAKRFWRVKVAGTSATLDFEGSIREAMPRIALWLHEQRNGSFTIDCAGSRAELSVSEDRVMPAVFAAQGETPTPEPGESYADFYGRLLVHFDGAESMAQYVANDWFDMPQLPWLGDDRVARFIHMNASTRQADKADPAEYAELKHYVSHTYPDLFQTLTLRA